MIPYNSTADNVSVLIGSKFKQVSLKTDQGQKLLAALRKSPQDADEIAELAHVTLYITRISEGRVQICSDDKIRIDGRVVDYGLRDMIFRVLNETGNASVLSKFLENVDQNPNKDVAQHTYAFITKGGMPLTEDGCFLAFKRVQQDFTSFRSGVEDVSITNALGETAIFKGHIPHWNGATLVMERALCDDNRNKTCSVGLHACSYGYLPHYCSQSGRIMIVKINPRDVVAVPNDYNDTKLRCCRLTVVGQVEEDRVEGHFTSAVEFNYDPVEEDEEAEEIVTLDGVQRDAVDDAGYDHNITGIDNFDPTEGENYEYVPDEFKADYRIAYTVAFEEECELDEFHSQKAYDFGMEDGLALGGKHRDDPDAVARSAFMPDYGDGKNFYNLPADHVDTYVVGFLRGYLQAWGLS